MAPQRAALRPRGERMAESWRIAGRPTLAVGEAERGAGRDSRPPVHATYGVTVTPGRIFARLAAIASALIPPRAPSRTMPSVSIQKWIGRV